MLNVRDPKDYPEKLKFILEQITINEIPKVVGSTAYITHKYPSDVDVFEDVSVNKEKEEAVLFYVKAFQNIIQKININSKLFFADFKIGEDTKYIFEKEIEDTNMRERKQITIYLYKNNLVTNDDYEKLLSLLGEADQNDFNMIIRKYRVLRWSPEEVLAGKKESYGGSYISLKEAIAQNALIKLDVISWITSRYLSIEVFFNLKYIKDGEYVSFYPMGSYKESLLKAVEFYSSRENYNPLKVAKRLWSLSRISDCGNLLEAINPLLSSDAAALNQVIADIETINIMLENKYNNMYTFEDYDKIFLQILGFKKRIYNHSLEKYDKIFDEVYDIWVKYNESNENVVCSKNRLTYLLDIMDKKLSELVFVQSKQYVEELERRNIVCPVNGNNNVNTFLQ